MPIDARSLAMVETWLSPLDDPDAPCGKDLEYDDEYLELMRLAQGKPEIGRASCRERVLRRV